MRICYHSCKSNHFIFHQKNCKVLSQSHHIMENKKDFWTISIRKRSVVSIGMLIAYMVLGIAFSFLLDAPTFFKEVYTDPGNNFFGWQVVKFIGSLMMYGTLISLMLLFGVNIFINVINVRELSLPQAEGLNVSDLSPLMDHMIRGLALGLVLGLFVPLFLLFDTELWSVKIILFTLPSGMISFLLSFFAFGLYREIQSRNRTKSQCSEEQLIPIE